MVILLSAVAIALTAVGQVLLKQAANSGVRGIFDRRVLTAYALFSVVVVLSYYLMQHIPLKAFTMIMSLNYVAVTLLAATVLRERMTWRKLLGTVLVSAGVWLFASGS